MVKIYKSENGELLYWETWEDEGTTTTHWGKVGDSGQHESFKTTNSSRERVKEDVRKMTEAGYRIFPEEEMATLIIEYKIEGMGNGVDLAKRHELESLLNNIFGWFGLGECDGGSVGAGRWKCALSSSISTWLKKPSKRS
jgi:hypothetical protein